MTNESKNENEENEIKEQEKYEEISQFIIETCETNQINSTSCTKLNIQLQEKLIQNFKPALGDKEKHIYWRLMKHKEKGNQ